MTIQTWFTCVGGIAIYLMMRSIIGARATNLGLLLALGLIIVWRF